MKPCGDRLGFGVSQIERQPAAGLLGAHGAVEVQRLGPEQIDFAFEAFGVDAVDVAADRPEAAVAGIVLQILVVVGRTDENALAVVFLRAFGVGEADLVGSPADECLDMANVGPDEAAQFRHFQDPGTLHHLDHLLRIVEIAFQFGEPRLRQHRDEGRLPLALETLQNDDEVELDAGLEDAGDRCDHHQSRNGAGVGVIRGAEIVDEQSLDALDAIPVLIVEVFADGVEAVLAADDVDGSPQIAIGNLETVAALGFRRLDDRPDGVVLVLGPEVAVDQVMQHPRRPFELDDWLGLVLAPRRLLARQAALNHFLSELVEGHHSGSPWIVLDDEAQIVECSLDRLVFGQVEQRPPRQRCCRVEVVHIVGASRWRGNQVVELADLRFVEEVVELVDQRRGAGFLRPEANGRHSNRFAAVASETAPLPLHLADRRAFKFRRAF